MTQTTSLLKPIGNLIVPQTTITFFRHNTPIQCLLAAALLSLSLAATADDLPKINKTKVDKELTDPAHSLAAKDWDALRAWFHQPRFNRQDGLSDYADDYRKTKVIPSAKLTAR